jgi:superfamily II DNA or RNA helicase
MANDLQLPLGLWDHQRKAVETVNDYSSSPAKAGKAALITMPTGTGKTGVIASSVTLLPALQGHQLVLTPWTALVRQLEADIRTRFWTRLPQEQRPEPPRVRRLPSSGEVSKAISETNESTVFVATIAAISVMARRSAELGYEMPKLFAEFDLVIVDEGHYEPAFKWSEAIRSLERPTVLLTATPYRNDEKFFLIGDEWRYRFPHHVAEEERFLRAPEFQAFEVGSDSERFAAPVLAFMDERFGRESEVRAIIRCKDSDTIAKVVQELQALGEPRVLGVHENFDPGDDVLRRHVPPTSENDSRVWVHQNKLIEGIDDPRFKVLAFFDSLRNDRAIVQQIGRVLRNPQRDPADMTAYVVGRGDRDLARTWKAYRKFDLQTEAESVATVPQLVERVLAAQPEAFYYDGGYRTRIDLDADDAWREFAFPLRTRVYRAGGADPPPSAKEIAQAATDEWEKFDRSVFKTQFPDETTAIVPYVTAENSPLLRSGTFIEPEFGYTLIRRAEDLVFVYDARGRTPEIVAQNFRPLQPSELQRLFPQGESSLTSVSLLNTDIGRQSARSRHIRAAAIDALAPDLTDYAYVCSIAEGYTEIGENQFRRYLGLSRSRISDYRATERDFEAYDAWLKSLHARLAGESVGASTFSRYATYVPTPADPRPVHVLLDIDGADFSGTEGDRVIPLRLDETAMGVVDGSFAIPANGEHHDARIGWDALQHRYHIESQSLRNRFFTGTEGDPRELLSYINDEQAIRVVPASEKAAYSHGHFFEPKLPLKKAGSFQLLDILHPVPELADAASEKGAAIVDDDWEASSVFGLISALAPGPHQAPDALRSLLEAPNMLLCTDLGTEMADFIATKGTRVVLMHAKASNPAKHYSASALHDVASQAIKNLLYLQPLTDVRPPTDRWTKPWSAAPHTTGTTRRLRVGNLNTANQIWTEIRKVIANPSSEREVWLVLGQSLSRQSLSSQAAKQKPAPEAIQVFSLLQTTWGAVSQIGARLRIFCSP